MPTTAYLLKGASVLLEYGMLLFLLVFVARLTRCIFVDVKAQRKKLSAMEQSAEGGAAIAVVKAHDPKLMGRRFVFQREIAIGRSPDNDIVIPENYVSHHHLVIYQHQNLYIAEDMGSRNSTQINGVPLVNKAYLRNGDQIQVGLVTMRFEI